MRLACGTNLGPYTVIDMIGAGGMGEVYRARDSRLDRYVAVKILPQDFAHDGDRLRRFEQEARAVGSLSHPNVVVVHDVGTHEGSPYVVTELLEGGNLRQRIMEGPLHPSKAIELAIQIARGLASAHDRGIVHRDIKPENLFLTRNGQVKILDFGLAKLVPRAATSEDETRTASPFDETESGTVLGTAGYMSPEQVRGVTVDHRSDIFSFGAVFYELLSGRRAFQRDSAVETMGAILNEDPPSLLLADRGLTPVLECFVKHCLQKRPEERFQSAHDLTLSLDALSLAAPSGVARTGPPSSAPSFRKITFRRGNLLHARFTPDGQTVVYSAAWDGEPSELYMTRIDGRESRRLAIEKADLLSVSGSGDLAILLKKDFLVNDRGHGTLARIPIGGGSPRELLEGVWRADWGPEDVLATVSVVPAAASLQLEYPAGHVLHQAGFLGSPRVSPNGRNVAVAEMLFGNHSLLVFDKDGSKRTLVQGSSRLGGLAWSPTGGEILYTSAPSPNETALCVAGLNGGTREIYRATGGLSLHDVSREGKILVHSWINRLETWCLSPGDEGERNLSWLDGSSVVAISQDGMTVVIREAGGGGGPQGGVYLRRTDGSPPVWLGEGFACDLSPDGKWVLTVTRTDPPEIVLFPSGAGRPRKIATTGLHPWEGRFVSQDRLCIDASDGDGRLRSYMVSLGGDEPRLMAQDPIANGTLSPEGRFIAFVDSEDNRTLLFPLEGGEPQPIEGALSGDVPIQWSEDGRYLYLRRFGELPVCVYRLELSTRERKLWRVIMPADAVGVIGVPRIMITRDGRSYAYTCVRVVSSDLFVAEGLL